MSHDILSDADNKNWCVHFKSQKLEDLSIETSKTEKEDREREREREQRL